MSTQPITLDMSTAQPLSSGVKLDMSTAQPIGSTIGPRQGGASGWLTDLESDIRYGGQSTGPGRLLHKMGYQGAESGPDAGAGRVLASPATGATYAAKGVVDRSPGEFLSGVGEASTIPMMFGAPEEAEMAAQGAGRVATTKNLTAPIRMAARSSEAIGGIPGVGSTLKAARNAWYANTPVEDIPPFKMPGRNLGLPKSPAPSTPEMPQSVPPTQAASRPIGDLLNEGLGGKPLRPNVPLKDQMNTPSGFTPVKSSALKSYRYDPIKREFEAITTDGSHHIYGDVAPEIADKFEAATSKGKAWTQLRNSPGVTKVAKVVNGKRMPTKPPIGMRSADPNDLTPTLRESLKVAMQKKSAQP